LHNKRFTYLLTYLLTTKIYRQTSILQRFFLKPNYFAIDELVQFNEIFIRANAVARFL